MDGEKGETYGKVLKTLVMFGDAIGAERLIDVTHPVHIVTSSIGGILLKPLYDIMDELIENGIRTKEPFTVDPRPYDHENIRCSDEEMKVFNELYSIQDAYEAQLVKVGLQNDNAYTCTCYLEEVGNIPKYGDILSWAESSAVVYANSVIGARSNISGKGRYQGKFYRGVRGFKAGRQSSGHFSKKRF
ncbi:MAG: aconitase X [Bacillota bacterium]